MCHLVSQSHELTQDAAQDEDASSYCMAKKWAVELKQDRKRWLMTQNQKKKTTRVLWHKIYKLLKVVEIKTEIKVSQYWT